jgi:hypothetical protein
MVSQHEMWSHSTTTSNKRRHSLDLRMGVRKEASKHRGKKQSKPAIDVVVIMVCDFF